MNAAIQVIKITREEDLRKAFDVRKKVFVEEQGCPPELEWENDTISIHFLATFNGITAGAARWRKTDYGYKLERFAVLKEFRGKKIGESLVAAVLQDIPADADCIYLNAQVQVVGFYKILGFEQKGGQFEEAGIIHYKMIKV